MHNTNKFPSNPGSSFSQSHIPLAIFVFYFIWSHKNIDSSFHRAAFFPVSFKLEGGFKCHFYPSDREVKPISEVNRADGKLGIFSFIITVLHTESQGAISSTRWWMTLSQKKFLANRQYGKLEKGMHFKF